MKLSPHRRRPRSPQALMLASVLACAPLLASPTAHAAPVFSGSDMDGDSYADAFSPSGCPGTRTADAPVSSLPVAENGAHTVVEASGTGTFTDTGDPTDTIAVSTTITGRGRVTSVGGNPGLLELDATGRVAVDAAKPVSACKVRAYSYVDLDFAFTVTRSGFLTITLQASPFTFVELYIRNATTGDAEFGVYAEDNKPSGAYTIYLPEGIYSGTMAAEAKTRTTKAIPSTALSASVRATFDVAGSQTATPVGRAKRYVTLPASRSCSTHSLDARVTSQAKKARRIQKVRFFVDGKAAGVVRRPAKGLVTEVPVADDAAATLRAVVTEVRRRNGKPGKVTEVTATYAPCS